MKFLQEKDFSETTIDITNNEYLAAYVGQDFYVAVDKDGKIESYIMPNAIDKNGAEKRKEIRLCKYLNKEYML